MITNLLCAAYSGVVQEERWAPYDYKFIMCCTQRCRTGGEVGTL